MAELTSSLMAEPTYFQNYLPKPEDYDRLEDYLAALKAGSEDTSAKIGEYYDPIAGVWRGGKTTEREQSVSKLNRFLNGFDDPGPGVGLRMQSWMRLNPEAAEQGYLAYDENGRSLVDPIIQATMEKYGFTPQTPLPEAPRPNWTQARLGEWNRGYLDEIAAGIGDGGSVNIWDPGLVDNMQEIRDATGDNTAAFIKHITQLLADNGYTYDPDTGFVTRAQQPIYQGGQTPAMAGGAVPVGIPAGEIPPMVGGEAPPQIEDLMMRLWSGDPGYEQAQALLDQFRDSNAPPLQVVTTDPSGRVAPINESRPLSQSGGFSPDLVARVRAKFGRAPGPISPYGY